MSVLNEVLSPELEKVREFIAAQPQAKGLEVSIYAWPDVKAYGTRVAEVSLSTSRSGSSWMQSDPDCAIVCFYAERLALEYLNDGKEDEGEISSAQWNLLYALFGVK